MESLAIITVMRRVIQSDPKNCADIEKWGGVMSWLLSKLSLQTNGDQVIRCTQLEAIWCIINLQAQGTQE